MAWLKKKTRKLKKVQKDGKRMEMAKKKCGLRTNLPNVDDDMSSSFDVRSIVTGCYTFARSAVTVTVGPPSLESFGELFSKSWMIHFDTCILMYWMLNAKNVTRYYLKSHEEKSVIISRQSIMMISNWKDSAALPTNWIIFSNVTKVETIECFNQKPIRNR